VSDYTRNFKKLAAFQKAGKKMGLQIRKVTTTKKLIRYTAVSKADGIVGFFHVEAPFGKGLGYGHIDNAF